MIHRRCHHKSVEVKNKWLVIGGASKCEVFDSITNTFSLLKEPQIPVSRTVL